MENIIIKNCPIIKEVKQDKTTLENFEAGKIQVENTKKELEEQLLLLENNIQEQQQLLNALLSEKEDLQTLVIKGNAGLTSKLLETNKRIKEAEVKLTEAKEDLLNFEELQKEQGALLEGALYDEFIESGILKQEFNNNAEALQIQYYSLLYKAFEVAKQLQGLQDEYINSVEYSFKEVYPHKIFIDMFSHRSYIYAVRNNFPDYNRHFNTYNNENVNAFVKRFEELKGNKDYILYK